MDRSRSKRNYHYDLDADSQSPLPRSKPRYDFNRRPHHQSPGPHHHRHRSGDGRRGPPPPPSPPPPSSAAVPATAASATTTFFQILCPDAKVGSIIGKNGSIITNFRRESGAWINVHPLVAGDEERIIETSDSRRREPDGRPPVFSPAQEALLMVHERILDSDFGEVDREEGGWRGGGGGREREGGKVTTRLVVPRLHVGCLLGKGGKIIEQMRMETRTHIRILPRDDFTPRCVSMAEEIVQVYSLLVANASALNGQRGKRKNTCIWLDDFLILILWIIIRNMDI